MADVITRFKLETTQFDSKLRDTAKALQGISHQASLGGKDFNKFSEEAVKSARALGTVQSGANNTKDRLRDLVGSYNDAAKAYNSLTDAAKKGEFGKAMSQSLTQLQQRIRETKEELYSMGDAVKGGGGGLFGGGKLDGMLQVFGGNVMTKIAGAGLNFASELGDMVKQGIELARAGEGIRIAFERLGRGDILDGLRKATHGTVTDLELMKAAVKFNDFKLPLEELGTMLAFAQQKAKDTGQSVDYMVDSIVTGLGRKSLMILDNLGLSAAEIKEKMAETGDMTKAVGAIIREEMAKAGDYVETAADRATQANVSLQNKMEELGRKFGPLEQASSNLWTSIKIGIMDIVGGPLTDFINKLTEAGRLANAYGVLGGNTKVGRMINNLSGAREGNRQSIYQQQQEQFWRYINPREQQIRDIQAWQRGERGEALQKRVNAISDKYGSLDATKIRAEVDAAKKMLSDYQQGAKAILAANPVPSPTSTTTITPTGGANGNTFDTSKIVFTGGEGFKADPNATFQSVWAMMGGDEGLRKMMGIGKQHTDLGRVLKEYVTDPDKSKRDKISEEKTDAEMLQGTQTMISSLQSIVGGINQLGIDIPQELNDIFGVLQTITGIVGSIQAMQQVGTWLGLFSHGGVVKAANGYVDGTTYSGDQIPAMLNAGEVVLNRSQAGVLAASLQSIGQGGDGGGARPYVNGEMIWLGLTNYLNRSGRGEIVTSRRK